MGITADDAWTSPTAMELVGSGGDVGGVGLEGAVDGVTLDGTALLAGSVGRAAAAMRSISRRTPEVLS